VPVATPTAPAGRISDMEDLMLSAEPPDGAAIWGVPEGA